MIRLFRWFYWWSNKGLFIKLTVNKAVRTLAIDNPTSSAIATNSYLFAPHPEGLRFEF